MKSLKTDNQVLETLNAIGPDLSSVVAGQLVNNFGMTSSAARKKIERARNSGDIYALNVRFKHNEQFLYTSQQAGTHDFRAKLLTALREIKSIYYLPLCGIAARGGIVLENHFATVSGLPLKSETEVAAEKALAVLLETGLLESSINAAGKCVRFSEKLAEHILSDQRMIARLDVEKAVVAGFADWLKLQGLAATDAATTRFTPDTPQFGYFQWDFVAPSYTFPLQKSSNKPGFVVADVHLGRKLSAADVQYFIHKCNAIRHSNPTPFMAFCIANWFEKDAFMLGRQNSVVFTTPRNFFGKGFSSSIDLLSQALELRDYVSSDSEFMSDVTDAIEALEHLTTAARTLKQSLLKIIIGRVLQKVRGTRPNYGVSFETSWGAFESTDILATGADQTIIVECRFLEKQVEPELIKNWLRTILLIKNNVLADGKIQKPEFWLCTNSYFSSEAHRLLFEANCAAQGYSIRWYDRRTLASLIDEAGDPAIALAFNSICPSDMPSSA